MFAGERRPPAKLMIDQHLVRKDAAASTRTSRRLSRNLWRTGCCHGRRPHPGAISRRGRWIKAEGLPRDGPQGAQSSPAASPARDRAPSPAAAQPAVQETAHRPGAGLVLPETEQGTGGEWVHGDIPRSARWGSRGCHGCHMGMECSRVQIVCAQCACSRPDANSRQRPVEMAVCPGARSTPFPPAAPAHGRRADGAALSACSCATRLRRAGSGPQEHPSRHPQNCGKQRAARGRPRRAYLASPVELIG